MERYQSRRLGEPRNETEAQVFYSKRDWYLGVPGRKHRENESAMSTEKTSIFEDFENLLV